MNFNINMFENLPGNLKKSDYIDFILYLDGLKPCVRLGKNNNNVYSEMINWCNTYNHAYIISEYGLMYISKSKFLASITMYVDDSTFSHEIILGKLLGYPICCTKKIKEIGENNIDQYEMELVNDNGFEGEYKYINSINYTKGLSLISHVPCSCKCGKSLKIAKRCLDIINMYKYSSRIKGLYDYWIGDESV